MRLICSTPLLLGAVFCAAPELAPAAADTSSHWVVATRVEVDLDRGTRLSLSNPGPDPVSPSVFLVEATTSGNGRVHRCASSAGPYTIPLQGSLSIDVDRDCGLLGGPFVGVAHAFVRGSSLAPDRIAIASTFLIKDAGGRVTHSAEEAGIALSAFGASSVEHEATGLANDPATGLRTACQVLTASHPASVQLDGELSLRDPTGRALGRPLPVKAAALNVWRVDDVFAAAGLGGMSLEGVRAHFVGRAGSPEFGVVLACTVEHQPAGSTLISSVFAAGTPLQAASATRQHASATRSAPTTPVLAVTGTENDLHVVFVRHQERLSCRARALDPLLTGALLVTLVAPDRSASFTNGSSTVRIDDTGLKAGINQGDSDAWGLIVEQVSPNPSLRVAYELGCQSGNGNSLPILKHKSPRRLPR
jgi:hypothetical protein